MEVHDHLFTVSKPEGVDEKIRNIYINYVQLMLDASRDKKLWDELFSSNERRLYYLNNKVGMTIPAGVHVIFDTDSLHPPKIHIKDKDGQIFISEGSEPFKVIEKLNNGEEIQDKMKVTSPEEIDMTIHEGFKESEVVLHMSFMDPSRDMTLFVLKYSDQEVVLSTCVP